MNFLKSWFDDKIENENKTKPFHQNKTREERIDWFSRTRLWHKVNPTVICALVNKFGDDPMFEVFVFASMDLNIIGQYEKLVEWGVSGNQLICSTVSEILCRGGNDCAKQIPPLLQNSQRYFKKLEQLYHLALDSFDTAIILDERQITAYLGIATVQCLVEKKEFALKAALRGIDQIKLLRERGDDVVLKQHRPDMWAGLQMEESKLKSIIEYLS